ncbi:hypothetical protein PUR71_09140 [Streptomyces sp. SP17BM10]|uniref:hypothetical protein n=1 Tax=Streptomyces sp. SP17BM10 TaxID=3002530 RepID=UPI002E76C360|nr:hypothetical protein [Streptomyces sp. SP17BM10]MEE1783080.1 hypothetical protein [Streptomyces sp. SP17BM10]
MSGKTRERKKFVIDTSVGTSVEKLATAMSSDQEALKQEMEDNRVDGIPAPVDFSKLTGTDADKLKQLEEMVHTADQRLDGEIQSAQTRYVIVVGSILRHIDENNLTAKASTGLTFAQYVWDRFRIRYRRARQLIEAAPIVSEVVAAKVLPSPNESQALAIAGFLHTRGPDVARQVVGSIEKAGQKVTAERLTEAINAYELSLIPSQPQLERAATPADGEKPSNGEQQTNEEKDDHEILEGELVVEPLTAKELRQAVSRRSLDLANALGRGRFTPGEIQRILAEAFIDSSDPAVYKAVLRRLRNAD